jgi:hypothetical protein
VGLCAAKLCDSIIGTSGVSYFFEKVNGRSNPTRLRLVAYGDNGRDITDIKQGPDGYLYLVDAPGPLSSMAAAQTVDAVLVALKVC